MITIPKGILSFFGKQTSRRMLDYLDKDPTVNLPRVLDLVLKAPLHPEHRNEVLLLQRELQSNRDLQQIVERIFHLSDKNVQHRGIVNVLLNSYLVWKGRHEQLVKELGCNIPAAILIDPTSRCNLHCEGCWAGAYSKHDTLSFDEVDRIVSEAKELGIHFIAMSGGEPLLWPHLLDLCRKHTDVEFMMYTNGTFIDEDMAEAMRAAGNMSPAISLEGHREETDARRGKGVFDKIMAAMDHLKAHGVLFGASVTITRHNCREVFSDEFIDRLIEKGVLYMWGFHYIPIGRNPDFSLRITPEQRAELLERVRWVRRNRPILIADFWNDGNLVDGCIAGGRRYFHIAADGGVEPCAFAHFSNENIKGRSLKEILQSPLFRAFQKRQPFNHNMLRPCPIIDNPQMLREIIAESGAKPTHAGADAILFEPEANELDQTAAAWGAEAERLEASAGRGDGLPRE